MALIQASFFSEALKRNVTIKAIIPVNEKTICKTVFPTLYLLHGLTDNCEAWVSNTKIEKLAEEAGIAVIMPSGENSFYIDQQIPNNNFGLYVGQELVEITRKLFPLSNRREETAIGGLSMGGFGAMRNGLKYCDTFGAIIALSSAIHIFEFPVGSPERRMLFHEDAVFGELSAASNTDKNPAYILKQLDLKQIPRIYMACGTEDGLITANRSFKSHLEEAGADLTYEEAPGIHEWKFWDNQIEKAIKWFVNYFRG